MPLKVEAGGSQRDLDECHESPVSQTSRLHHTELLVIRFDFLAVAVEVAEISIVHSVALTVKSPRAKGLQKYAPGGARSQTPVCASVPRTFFELNDKDEGHEQPCWGEEVETSCA